MQQFWCNNFAHMNGIDVTFPLTGMCTDSTVRSDVLLYAKTKFTSLKLKKIYFVVNFSIETMCKGTVISLYF